MAEKSECADAIENEKAITESKTSSLFSNLASESSSLFGAAGALKPRNTSLFGEKKPEETVKEKADAIFNNKIKFDNKPLFSLATTNNNTASNSLISGQSTSISDNKDINSGNKRLFGFAEPISAKDAERKEEAASPKFAAAESKQKENKVQEPLAALVNLKKEEQEATVENKKKKSEDKDEFSLFKNKNEKEGNAKETSSSSLGFKPSIVAVPTLFNQSSCNIGSLFANKAPLFGGKAAEEAVKPEASSAKFAAEKIEKEIFAEAKPKKEILSEKESSSNKLDENANKPAASDGSLFRNSDLFGNAYKTIKPNLSLIGAPNAEAAKPAASTSLFGNSDASNYYFFYLIISNISI